MLGIKLKFIESKPPNFIGKYFVFIYDDKSASSAYKIEYYDEVNRSYRILGGGFYNKDTFQEDLKKGVLKIVSHV